MTTETTIHDSIDKAATTVGSVWPIHSFVTANPLAGFEDLPFDRAVIQAADLLGGRGYPRPETYRAALEDGQIDPEILEAELAERGFEGDPESLLDRMDTDAEHDAPDTATERVDHVLTKWLADFIDEGRAEWAMPDREAGFYAAFRTVAEHDGDIPEEGIVRDLPETPLTAIERLLDPYPESQWVPILEEQLAALPGWTGFVKQRVEDGGDWQSAHPITLEGYLAARFALLDAFDVDIEPSTGPDSADADTVDELADAFLTAWEASYRSDVVEHVADESKLFTERESSGRPDAQLVFCIDTRSEVIRRHVEAAGDYETHGYAGFFGIPMEYQGYDDVAVDACPPILDPQHRISEVPTDDDTRASHATWTDLRETAGSAVKTLKTNPATAFGFVEQAGSGYGLALAARTLVPGRVADLFDTAEDAVPDGHEFCDQTVHHQHTYAGDLPVGLTHEEKVEYAATAFDLMGWAEFGRLVVFTGHASETTNNPYDASLDCGACAGNPGGLTRACSRPSVTTRTSRRRFASAASTYPRTPSSSPANTTRRPTRSNCSTATSPRATPTSSSSCARTSPPLARARRPSAPGRWTPAPRRVSARRNAAPPIGRRPAPSGGWPATPGSSSGHAP